VVCVAELLILDDPAVADAERVPFDLTPFVGPDGPDYGDAAIEAYMAESARGQTPVDFRVPNRTVTVPLVLHDHDGTTLAEARSSVQAKVALFQSEGGWVTRDSAVGVVYADVVSATLKLGGSSAQAHGFVDADAVLTLECLPDWYEDEIELDDLAETSATELVEVLQQDGVDAVIRGNYPGRVRLVVDEDDAETQLGLLAAFRSRHYSADATAAEAYEAEALTRLGAAALATVTGASGAGTNNVVQHANLAPHWTPVLSTQIIASGHMTHRGSYRVWARVRTPGVASEPVYSMPRVRLIWGVGAPVNPTENPPKQVPGHSNFYDMDLGEVRLDPAGAGTHQWQGIFQALKESPAQSTIQFDKVWIVPVDESYTLLRTPLGAGQGGGTFNAWDAFEQAAGALTGKTPIIGGNWTALSGSDADDFAVDGTNDWAERSSLSDAAANGRAVTVGTTNYPAVGAMVDINRSSEEDSRLALIARATSQTAILQAGYYGEIDDPGKWFVRRGDWSTGTELAAFEERLPADEWWTMMLVVTTGGQFAFWRYRQGGAPGEPLLVGYDSTLAAGGSNATGKVGIHDHAPGSTVHERRYDNFVSWTPNHDAVLYPSQSAELRTDGIEREDSAGGVYGPLVPDSGNLPRIPPSGLEQRPVELFLKWSRGDFDRHPDSGIDDGSVRPFYRPCWLYLPDGT
jgi:hypothetical protein